MSAGVPELLLIVVVFLLVLAPVALIGALVYLWMKGSRGSQGRVEEQNRAIIELLREQNELLRSLQGRNSEFKIQNSE